MNQTIIDAIRNRRVINFTYDGERRSAEPHCYGIDTKGHEALRAWQRNKGWRLFHLSEIRQLSVDAATFTGPRPGYNPNDKHMQRIIVAL